MLGCILARVAEQREVLWLPDFEWTFRFPGKHFTSLLATQVELEQPNFSFFEIVSRTDSSEYASEPIDLFLPQPISPKIIAGEHQRDDQRKGETPD